MVKLDKINNLQTRINNIVKIYDFWFNKRHEFWLKEYVPVYVPASEDNKSAYSFIYFKWEDHPEEYKKFTQRMHKYQDYCNTLRRELDVELNKLSEDEVYGMEVGWEDVFYNKLDTFLGGE